MNIRSATRTVVRRLVDRGLVEKAGTGSPAVSHYRVTTTAIAATGRATLKSFDAFWPARSRG